MPLPNEDTTPPVIKIYRVISYLESGRDIIAARRMQTLPDQGVQLNCRMGLRRKYRALNGRLRLLQPVDRKALLGGACLERLANPQAGHRGQLILHVDQRNT